MASRYIRATARSTDGFDAYFIDAFLPTSSTSFVCPEMPSCSQSRMVFCSSGCLFQDAIRLSSRAPMSRRMISTEASVTSRFLLAPPARPQRPTRALLQEAMALWPAGGYMVACMCGVFGVYGHPEAAKLTYLGLHALQHRGQESAGIISSAGKRLYGHRAIGLVHDAFTPTHFCVVSGAAPLG